MIWIQFVRNENSAVKDVCLVVLYRSCISLLQAEHKINNEDKKHKTYSLLLSNRSLNYMCVSCLTKFILSRYLSCFTNEEIKFNKSMPINNRTFYTSIFLHILNYLLERWTTFTWSAGWYKQFYYWVADNCRLWNVISIKCSLASIILPAIWIPSV